MKILKNGGILGVFYMAKKRKRRRRRSFAIGDSRLALILVAAVFVLYLGASVVKAYSGSFETTAAVKVTANDSIIGEGWFFRDETTIEQKKSGSVKHSVFSGERVQQDAVLATVYSTEEALKLSREIEPLEKNIALLEDAINSERDGSDAAKLEQQITESLQELAGHIKSGSGTSLGSSAETLRALSLKKNAAGIEQSELEGEMSRLKEQLNSLKLQVSGQSQEIASPVSGYFSEVVDGYENVMRPELLDKLTLAQLDELIKGRANASEGSEAALGKVIQGFSWYLAVKIPKEDAARLKSAKSTSVSFTQSSLESPATVRLVSDTEEGEYALAVLEGSVFGSEMVSMREQPVEIILGTYTGLKVPKQAVRMENNENGDRTIVYVLSGSLQKKKNITDRILFDAGDYYVVKQSASDADALVVQDQIIIKGKGLQNNSVVKK